MGRKRASFKIKDLPRPKKLGKVFGAKKRDSNEKYCAKILSNFGYDIIFLPESKISGVHTPDILWKRDGKGWEIKTIIGSNNTTVQKALHHATKQSNYVILNITGTKRDINRVRYDVIDYISRRRTSIVEVVMLDKRKYCRIKRSDI